MKNTATQHQATKENEMTETQAINCPRCGTELTFRQTYDAELANLDHEWSTVGHAWAHAVNDGDIPLSRMLRMRRDELKEQCRARLAEIA
jgi:hypothetical protein